MLELVGWNVGMSAFAAILLVAGAIIIGAIAHFIGEVRTGWEGPIVAVAALIGGYVGSEALGAFSTWGYAFEGLYVLPALIGAVVVGVAVDAIVRYLTHGSYVHSARPI
jgi:uncharacterized membrane protein YeaQ/YmgE (transglycosylase-associated protein family)